MQTQQQIVKEISIMLKEILAMLKADQRKILIGRRYNREKKKQGGNHGNQYTEVAKGQNGTLPNNKAKELATENNISSRTVKRYGKEAENFE